jgi:hypothetical protein
VRLFQVSEAARNREELIFCLHCGGGVDWGRSEVWWEVSILGTWGRAAGATSPGC